MLIGSIIDEQYQIITRLGEGGMASVFKVRELGLERIVALKLLHPTLLTDKESRKRFLREGKILAALSNPHILQFYKFGIWNDHHYIAMEYLEGKSLRETLDQEELSPEACIKIVIQICDGMTAAHNERIVHRDLKPGNIMIVEKSGEPDIVKIVDFGLARLSTKTTQCLTQTGALVGSVHYMSPEQCRGQQADLRSDIYSLGCLLFEALTGRPPFIAENPLGLIHLHSQQVPEPPSRFTSKLPLGLDEILMRSLDKEPDQRYQTMLELKKDLELVLQQRGAEVTLIHGAKRSKWSLNRYQLAACALCFLMSGTILILQKTRSVEPYKSDTQSLALGKSFPQFLQLKILYPRSGDRLHYIEQWIAKYANVSNPDTAQAYYSLAVELENIKAPADKVNQAVIIAARLYGRTMQNFQQYEIIPEALCLACKSKAELERRTDPQKARTTILTAIDKWKDKLDPVQKCDLILEIAGICTESHDLKGEEKCYRWCIEVAKKAQSALEGTILIRYIPLLQTEKRNAEANKLLDQLVSLSKKNPTRFDLAVAAATLLVRNGDYEESWSMIELAKLSCFSERDRRMISQLTAICLQGQKKYSEAHAYFVRAMSYSSKDEKWGELVDLLRNARMGRLEALAEPIFLKQVETTKENPLELTSRLHQLAARLYEEGEIELSLTLWERCVENLDLLSGSQFATLAEAIPIMQIALIEAHHDDAVQKLSRKTLAQIAAIPESKLRPGPLLDVAMELIRNLRKSGQPLRVKNAVDELLVELSVKHTAPPFLMVELLRTKAEACTTLNRKEEAEACLTRAMSFKDQVQPCIRQAL